MHQQAGNPQSYPVAASPKLRRPPIFELTRGQNALGFLSLAVLVATTALNLVNTRNALDQMILEWFVSHRSTGVSALMLTLTDAFTPTNIVLLAFAGAVGFALWRRSLKLGVAIVGAVGVSSVLDQLLKHLVGRTRPDLSYQLVNETDLSFPSGHATGIVALCIAIYLAARFTLGRTMGVMSMGWALGILAILVCISRLYVAAHWATEVLAGAALGTCITLGWFWCIERIFARWAAAAQLAS